jgi:N-acetylglucosaminyl-diphospho-decaprenol L-rhamnosyltransferase
MEQRLLVDAPTTSTQPDVSIIIVSYNTAHLLDRMFAALEASKAQFRLQVIVVDNASRDASVDILRAKYPEAELIQNSINLGFGRANNQAIPLLKGRYVLLLNTDAFLSPDTLEKTISFMDTHHRCGVLGVKLVGEDGTPRQSSFEFASPWVIRSISRRLPDSWTRSNGGRKAAALDYPAHWECDWVPGCYYLIRREVIDQVGLFDPRFFIYYEEIDHCHAVRRAGWTVVCYPLTQVVHIGGESARPDGLLNEDRNKIESSLLYFRKHYGLLGVLTWVFRHLSSNLVRAAWSLMRRGDAARLAATARYSSRVIQLLLATRIASRPTR